MAGEKKVVNGRREKGGHAGLAVDHAGHRRNLGDVPLLGFPLCVGMGDQVAGVVDDRCVSFAPEVDHPLQADDVVGTEPAQGESVGRHAADQVDRRPPLVVLHHLGEGGLLADVWDDAGERRCRHLGGAGLAGAQLPDDIAVVVDIAEMVKAELARQHRQRLQRFALLGHHDQVLEGRLGIVHIAFERGGDVGRQQQVLLAHRADFLLERCAFDPCAQENHRDDGDDDKRRCQQVSKLQLHAWLPNQRAAGTNLSHRQSLYERFSGILMKHGCASTYFFAP